MVICIHAVLVWLDQGYAAGGDKGEKPDFAMYDFVTTSWIEDIIN